MSEAHPLTRVRASLGGKPIETLTPEEARKQPTPADAVKKVLTDMGKSTAPEAGVTVTHSTGPNDVVHSLVVSNGALTVSGGSLSVSTTLNAGTGADTINVRRTSVGTSTIVNAGGGNDTINVGDANLLSGLASVTIVVLPPARAASHRCISFADWYCALAPL